MTAFIVLWNPGNWEWPADDVADDRGNGPRGDVPGALVDGHSPPGHRGGRSRVPVAAGAQQSRARGGRSVRLGDLLG